MTYARLKREDRTPELTRSLEPHWMSAVTRVNPVARTDFQTGLPGQTISDMSKLPVLPNIAINRTQNESAIQRQPEHDAGNVPAVEMPAPEHTEPALARGPTGVTAEQLAKIVPVSPHRATQLAPHLNAAMQEFDITTPAQRAFFIAQTAHESAGMNAFRERGSEEKLNQKYANRLGNTQAGDGSRYRGRGAIQITGRELYAKYGRKLGLDLVSNPELLERDAAAFRASAAYWKTRKPPTKSWFMQHRKGHDWSWIEPEWEHKSLNEIANIGSALAYDYVSLGINPRVPYENLEHRRHYLQSASQALGHSLASGQRPPAADPAKQPLIMPKLMVGAVDDPAEIEADQVAEQVMRMQLPNHALDEGMALPVRPPHIARKPATDTPFAHDASLVVEPVLRSGGQPLDAETLAFMEPRFGRDFSTVRLHTNDIAAESARRLNARAYTVGRDIVFGTGEYNAQSTSNNKLLAHELTHVMQQTNLFESAIRRDPKISREIITFDAKLEQIAHSLAYKASLISSDVAWLQKNGWRSESMSIYSGDGDLQFMVLHSIQSEQGPTNTVVPGILAFRGSKELRDLIEDAVPEGVGMYPFIANQPMIFGALQRLSHENAKVITIGHSLGGALAQIAAAYYPSLVNQVVTFQSPGISESQVKRLVEYNRLHKNNKVDSRHHRVFSRFAGDDFVEDAGDSLTPGANYNFEYLGFGPNAIPKHTGYPLASLYSQTEQDALDDNSPTRGKTNVEGGVFRLDSATTEHGARRGNKSEFGRRIAGKVLPVTDFQSKYLRVWFEVDRLVKGGKVAEAMDKLVGSNANKDVWDIVIASKQSIERILRNLRSLYGDTFSAADFETAMSKIDDLRDRSIRYERLMAAGY